MECGEKIGFLVPSNFIGVIGMLSEPINFNCQRDTHFV